MAQPDLLAAEAERIVSRLPASLLTFQLSEVEASRDLTQSIVHVDMDAFVSSSPRTADPQYASVEVRHDPSLKGKPFGVGQGVLTTASVRPPRKLRLTRQYEARKYGCRSGMAGFIAKRLCPQIILWDLCKDMADLQSASQL